MDYKTMLLQIGQIYQKLTRKQRIVIAASIVVVVGFLVGLSLYSRGTGGVGDGYAVLVENVSPSSSAAIVTRLEQNGVPYRLRDENTILVPADQVYRQRMFIASEGLIKESRIGWESFDSTKFGITTRELDIQTQRSLEGELARTIETLEPIKSAVVHVAIPKESTFVDRQKPPTASVVVNIREGLKLTRKQIDGIKNIVSHAVPKLVPANVRISDQNGITLDEQEAYDSDIIAAEVKYKRDYESELEEKIVNSLAPFAGGRDKIEVSVNIEFDFSKQESQSEIYDPNAIVRSEQTLSERKDGRKDKEVQGVPGAVSNIGPVEGLEGDGLRETYSKDQVTTNNELSKTITNTKKQFGVPIRISAAVTIDGKYQDIADENGIVTNQYVPLTPEQLSGIENIVKSTINFNAARGDSVVVQNLPFHQESAKVESQVKTFYGRFVEPFIPPVKYLIAAVLLFFFYKKVIAPFMQKMLEDAAAQEEAQEGPNAVLDDAEDTLEKFNAARKKVEEQLGFGDNFNEDSIQYDVLLEKLRGLVTDKSEEISALLQNLIQNDSEFSENKDL
ncbi:MULTISPECIES: flagellar basal-body MS-ring/collar protein FliF [unclassified Campylobacter]|uniref:flagellar basal-body MS-ring/collar protein FliF n=1 Tax=unclassified Campylobacter TaxID=2593542 RepID=UPI001237C254|nr:MULTISPECIES: flagellar basal-body MS-ring/collar protein FliF [unclassified Campylobacter]KAA6226030.1 flagellar basal body M-ring protein FliF [Campylobacter sp. LR196d]KAA6226623.1 flagellar basal body M-ring protein FliF [Campylobacter sp. LR286c]KAA6227553.1 flagellar basal body M-ring protein FliF [Campylobacter sp. LR185c]KAA6229993.1 flagellar basal body M-ring protein FliF [Campylobacter sp. LR291e]KAA6230836.1 flagellar basal body M-ring protein FliF [Campylobacter sp. LR264d]